MTLVVEEIDLDGMIAAKAGFEPILVGKQGFAAPSCIARLAAGVCSKQRQSQVNQEFSTALQIEAQ